MSKAAEIAADTALDTLFNLYYDYHRVTRGQIAQAAILGNEKVLGDLRLLVGSLDRETLAAIVGA